jgi:hypothetical protein
MGTNMTTQSHILAQTLTLPGQTIDGPIVFGTFKTNTLGAIIDRAVPFIIAFAGIGLLIVIIGGGFTLLTSAGDTKKMDAGKQQITNGVIGFVIILVAYWLVQIAGYVLGIGKIGEIFK